MTIWQRQLTMIHINKLNQSIIYHRHLPYDCATRSFPAKTFFFFLSHPRSAPSVCCSHNKKKKSNKHNNRYVCTLRNKNGQKEEEPSCGYASTIRNRIISHRYSISLHFHMCGASERLAIYISLCLCTQPNCLMSMQHTQYLSLKDTQLCESHEPATYITINIYVYKRDFTVHCARRQYFLLVIPIFIRNFHKRCLEF